MKESRDYELKSLELVTKRKLGECRTYFDEIDMELAQQGFTNRSGTSIPIYRDVISNPRANATITRFINSNVNFEGYQTGLIYVGTGPKDLVDIAMERVRAISQRNGWIQSSE